MCPNFFVFSLKIMMVLSDNLNEILKNGGMRIWKLVRLK